MPNLIGTGPAQCPTNADLGKLAFMDVVDTVTNNPYLDTAISDTKPSLLLDFANSKTLDPRITYTRASTASYYDGKTTAVAEQNLLTYSQDFSNAPWVKTLTLTSSTQTAPDGTNTAYLMTGDQGQYINQQLSSADLTKIYVVSVYAKAGTENVIRLYAYKLSGGQAGFVDFDISTGTASSPGGTYLPSNVSIVAVGGGWYRCSFAVSLVSGTGMGMVIYRQSAGTGLTFSMWGAQLEQRSAVSSYTPTTSSPITNYIPALQTAAAGVPRFDHDPVTGESKGFLIEEQRTNLQTYSTDFKNSAWSVTAASIESNVAIAPDGSLTASKIVEDSTNAVHTIGSFTGSYTNGTTYTYSVYLKAAGRTIAVFYESNWSGAEKVSFDLSAGTATVLNASYNTTASIQNVGNGWHRCIWSETAQSSGTGMGGLTRLRISNGSTTTYTGNGYSGLYIWGAQLEAGSFATSYIPTTSAQVTRSADAASITGANFSSWYNQAEGSLYAESKNPVASAYSSISYISDSTTNNSIRLGQTAAGYSDFSVVVAGSASCSIQTITIANTSSKVAASYRVNDFARSVNGAVVDIDTNGLLPSVTQLQIGTNPAGSALNGTIKKLAYYPKRLSDAELQEMTQ